MQKSPSRVGSCDDGGHHEGDHDVQRIDRLHDFSDNFSVRQHNDSVDSRFAAALAITDHQPEGKSTKQKLLAVRDQGQSDSTDYEYLEVENKFVGAEVFEEKFECIIRDYCP